MRFNVVLIFCFIFFASSAQKVRSLDSMETAYLNLKTDSAKFDNLNERIKIYRLNDPAKAMASCWEAYELSRRTNNENARARALFNLAISYRKIGNYDTSIVLYLQVLPVFEKGKDDAQIGSCYGSLGIAFWQQKQYNQSLKYLRKSLGITRKLGRRANECSNLNNMGGVFTEQKQYDSAIAYLHMSLKISEEDKDTVGLADGYGNMGGVYLLKGDTNSAMKYSLLGEHYSRLSGNAYQLFTSLGNIAQISYGRKNYPESERYSLMAIELAEKLGTLEGRQANYHVIARLYNSWGKYDKAYKYLTKYIEVHDSLMSESRMKQMTDLEAKYESAKKDKELISEKSTSEKKSTLLYMLVAGLSLVLILVFFILRGYLNKKKYLGEIVLAKHELEIKSTELESRNKDVTDSINYARKIQNAVLPNTETIFRSAPASFIFYKPKDIVSGDFYWFHEIDKDNYILVCADCTGHGVPGALMTVICSNLLNQTVIDNKIDKPAAILLEVDKLLNMTLKQNADAFHGVQDGMDISLLRVNKAKKEIVITSAKRPVLFIRNNEVRDMKGSRFSLGGMKTSGEKNFEEISINYQAGDILYFFTDGYHDQFGGENGKKFSSKRLKDLLFKIHQLGIDEQKKKLDDEMKEWMGNLEQVDDMCVIGIRFT
ncbi:MAG: hypothetical protein K0S32_1087 [Bacteroidetes bacterium]|nr:hypothetical protein [Bacteroidota bacterium]